MEPIAVVINAGAGKGHGRELSEQAVDAFARVGLAAQVALARDGEQLADSVREALDRGVRLLVGGGGDGTLNAIAAALLAHPRGGEVEFGILPLGTLNHFAKDLGIPLELDEAAAVIARGRVMAVDVGEVNGKPFLNNSSLGLYPDIVHERERQQARLGRGKWSAFLWSALAALRRYSFHTVTLQVEGREISRSTPFVFVGNNDYDFAGTDIGARHCLDGGELCVWVAHHTGRLGLLWFALAALFGQLERVHGLDHLRTPELTIASQVPRLRVSTDGEEKELDTPLRYRCRPRALRVRVPQASPEQAA
jgi:diacylglycerol kinase family enzyme